MKYYRYRIVDDEIKEFIDELDYIPADFIEYKNTFGVDYIHYKIVNGKIIEAITEAHSEPVARRRLEDFISQLNVSLVQ